MSNVSHISTVDRGLKMKIKRTKVGPNSAKNDASKHEAAQKGDSAGGSTAQHPSTGVPTVNGVPPSGSTGGVSVETKPSGSAGSTPTKVGASGLTPELPKDKSPKVKAQFAKKDKNKEKGGGALSKAQGDANPGALANGSSGSAGVGSSSSSGSSSGSANSTGNGSAGSALVGVANGLDMYPQITMEPRVAVEAVSVKREMVRGPVLDDPYEFNAKVEDGLCLPPKKLKTDTKVDTACSPAHIPSHQDASTETCTIGVNTESEFLGPCEPGTSVTLQGIVWQEQTDNGLLVVNVTWRDKTYVGTLLDATKNEWAPPRPNCDSPVSDFETRTPKGRGKRGSRTAAGTPSSDRSINEGRKLRKTRRGSNNPAPASPARPDSSSSVKRKARNNDESDSNKGDKGNNGPSSNKRSRSCSRGGASGTESPTLPTTIECPEPNCKKKYKHINGLRYHQTHAHQQPASAADEDKEDEEDMDTDSRDSKKNAEAKKDQQISERAERAKAKEQRLQREKQREKSLEKDCAAVEDNIPLKAFAGRVNAQNGERAGKPETSTSKSVECSSIVTSTLASAVITPPTAMPSTTLTSTTVSSKKKDGGPSMSVSLAVSKTAGAPGQVHQIAGLGGLPVMASSNTVQAPVIPVPPATVASTSTPIPITVAPLGSVDSKDSKMDKAKNKLAARPIVPAPTSMAMPSPGTASQGLGPSSVHPPVSQGLKMIQPKPTIMGEYTSVNPSLAELKEKKKSKKKKEKEMGQGQSGGTSPLTPLKVNKEDMRCDRPAVIKSVTSPPVSRPVDGATRKESIPSIEVSKPIDSPRPCGSALVVGQPSTPGSQMSKTPDQMRSVQPPGLLKVNSPLHVSAGERKTPVTDDVQSPAYSDISDANDSSSPQQQESPKKETDVAAKKDSNSTNPTQDSNTVAPPPFGGMYFYNRPSPLFSPSVNTPHASPNTNKPQTQSNTDSSQHESNRSSSSGNEHAKPSGDISNPENKDPTSKGPAASKPEGQGPPQQQLPPLPPQQQQQQTQQQQQQQQQQLYQQQQMEYHQKLLQVYAHIRLMPQQAQSQYLAAYGMLEPYAQCVLSQQDPHYRQMVERLAQEQKRLQEQQGHAAKRPESSETPTHKQHGSRPPSTEHSGTPEAGPSGVPKLGQPLYGPHAPVPERMNEGKPLGEGGDNKESREQQTLREKQNENHQILKENIELKSQMDRGRQEMDLNRQKQEDRRMMYFQQKQMEQHRSAEKRKLEMHGKPPELKTNVPTNLLGLESAARHSGIPLGAIKTEDLKKEPVDHHRMKDSPRVADSKPSSEDKKMVSDKSRTVHTDAPKSKPSDQPGLGMPSASCASSSSSLNPASTPQGQYTPYSFPVIPSHYGHMQVDPSHPMYRQMGPHMIGYAAAGPPAYIHPSQLGYRMGPPPPIDAEKDVGKGESKPSGPPPSSEESGKGSSEGSQAPHFYSPSVHKIHELAHEKARARPGSASPAPSKPGEGEPRGTAISALSSGDKQRGSPPPQRHLHTHHHTHVLSHGFYPGDPSFAMFAANAHGTAPNAPPALQQPPFSK